jgi:acyl carrier protein
VGRLPPDEVIDILQSATRAVPGSLKRDTPLAGLPGWDSLGMVQFLAEIADRTGRRFHVSEVRTPATVGELADLVAVGSEGTGG